MGGKRKWEGRMKKGESFRAKFRRLDIPGGFKGIILTFNAKASDALREAMNFIHSVADNTEDEKSWDEDCRGDLSDQLNEEIQNLHGMKQRFTPLKDIIPGVIFIQFGRKEDIPSEFVSKIFENAKSDKGSLKCRHIARLLPVDVAVWSELKLFGDALKHLVARTMPHSAAASKEIQEAKPDEDGGCEVDESCNGAQKVEKVTPNTGGKDETNNEGEDKGNIVRTENSDLNDIHSPKVPVSESAAKEVSYAGTWSCIFQSRGFQTVRKKEVLDISTKFVGGAYKVDILHADHTILVECNPVFFGASVVKNYGSNFRFNLFRMCNQELEGRKLSDNNTSDTTEQVNHLNASELA